MINESHANIQQACKRLKTVIANKQAISGQNVSFKERVFFPCRGMKGFRTLSRGLKSWTMASVNPPIHLFAAMVAIWGKIALVIILGKEINETRVTAKDHHLMVGTGITMIPEGVEGLAIQEALFYSSHSVMVSTRLLPLHFNAWCWIWPQRQQLLIFIAVLVSPVCRSLFFEIILPNDTVPWRDIELSDAILLCFKQRCVHIVHNLA